MMWSFPSAGICYGIWFGPFPGVFWFLGSRCYLKDLRGISYVIWRFICVFCCDFPVLGLFHVWFYCCVDLVFFHDGPVRWI